jgi:hypothetical protein
MSAREERQHLMQKADKAATNGGVLELAGSRCSLLTTEGWDAYMRVCDRIGILAAFAFLEGAGGTRARLRDCLERLRGLGADVCLSPPWTEATILSGGANHPAWSVAHMLERFALEAPLALEEEVTLFLCETDPTITVIGRLYLDVEQQDCLWEIVRCATPTSLQADLPLTSIVIDELPRVVEQSERWETQERLRAFLIQGGRHGRSFPL